MTDLVHLLTSSVDFMPVGITDEQLTDVLNGVAMTNELRFQTKDGWLKATMKTLTAPLIKCHVYLELDLPFDYADPRTRKYRKMVWTINNEMWRVVSHDGMIWHEIWHETAQVLGLGQTGNASTTAVSLRLAYELPPGAEDRVANMTTLAGARILSKTIVT
ncbi:unnamed protein product, partial [Darwinula stevensoni]